MIKVTSRANIDDLKWNRCIENAHNESIYGYSWYLDCVSETWFALILNDYEAVFPLIFKRKMGIRYLNQTCFYQRTAIFSSAILPAADIIRFYKAIPFRYVLRDFCVDEYSYLSTMKGESKVNLVLPLHSSEVLLKAGYHKNTNRNIKKAQGENIVIRKDVDVDRIVKVFKENRAQTLGMHFSDADYGKIKSLMQYGLTNNNGVIYAAFNENEIFLGAVFFMYSKNRIYYLFSGVTTEGQQKRALFALVDFFISQHQNTNKMLDFEGSMSEGVARFYAGFGAQTETYYHLRTSLLNSNF